MPLTWSRPRLPSRLGTGGCRPVPVSGQCVMCYGFCHGAYPWPRASLCLKTNGVAEQATPTGMWQIRGRLREGRLWALEVMAEMAGSRTRAGRHESVSFEIVNWRLSEEKGLGGLRQEGTRPGESRSMREQDAAHEAPPENKYRKNSFKAYNQN